MGVFDAELVDGTRWVSAFEITATLPFFSLASVEKFVPVSVPAVVEMFVFTASDVLYKLALLSLPFVSLACVERFVRVSEMFVFTASDEL